MYNPQKYIFNISGAILLVFIFQSCEKEEVPALIASDITNITLTSAVVGGTITYVGAGKVVATSVFWNTDTMPTIDDNLLLACSCSKYT